MKLASVGRASYEARWGEVSMALRGTSRPRDSRRVLPSTSKALATAVRAPFGDPPLSAGFDGRLALGRTYSWGSLLQSVRNKYHESDRRTIPPNGGIHAGPGAGSRRGRGRAPTRGSGARERRPIAFPSLRGWRGSSLRHSGRIAGTPPRISRPRRRRSALFPSALPWTCPG